MRYRALLFPVMIAAAAAAPAQQIQPGQWETVSTVKSVDMPGAPPQIAKMMNGQTTRITHCVTAEDAAKRPEQLVKQDGSCKMVNFSMRGGTLVSEMRCTRQGQTMTVKTAGRFTPTAYTATSSAVASGGRMNMRIESSVAGRRTGPCTKK